LVGDLIEFSSFFVVYHAKCPGHDKLQKGKDPSPCNTAIKGFIQDSSVGCKEWQGEIEAKEEDCERDNEDFLYSNQLSEVIRLRNG
jgi:hypothetical protein